MFNLRIYQLGALFYCCSVLLFNWHKNVFTKLTGRTFTYLSVIHILCIEMATREIKDNICDRTIAKNTYLNMPSLCVKFGVSIIKSTICSRSCWNVVKITST